MAFWRGCFYRRWEAITTACNISMCFLERWTSDPDNTATKSHHRNRHLQHLMHLLDRNSYLWRTSSLQNAGHTDRHAHTHTRASSRTGRSNFSPVHSWMPLPARNPSASESSMHKIRKYAWLFSHNKKTVMSHGMTKHFKQTNFHTDYGIIMYICFIRQ